MKQNLALASFIVATLLCVLGMLLPPLGDIYGNVLIASGQFLILCATLLGVKSYVEKLERMSKQ